MECTPVRHPALRTEASLPLRSRQRRSRNRILHLMLLPGALFTLVYAYGPMFGLVMAFQKFVPVKGFFHSRWVGFENFRYVFDMPDFQQALLNTLTIATSKMILMILIPLGIALLLNELNRKRFTKFVQTCLFLPFFLSWAILGGIVKEVFALDGAVNVLMGLFGIAPHMFMADNTAFPLILIFSDVWKGMGYNMIIFLAAITSIDASLYEAAEVDGAGRWRQMWSITLPGMMPIIILLSVLGLGSLLNAGFDQVLILYNPIVYRSSDIIDTLVYRIGIIGAQYSPAAAIGLFKSAISLTLVSVSYYLAYKFNDYRIF